MSPPSSQSSGFPKKAALPWLNSLSLNLLACCVTSIMSLGSVTPSDIRWVLLLLLNRFSRVRLCATPEMAAHPSLWFSRQEHWSGLPFPSPMHESEKWKWSLTVTPSNIRLSKTIDSILDFFLSISWISHSREASCSDFRTPRQPMERPMWQENEVSSLWPDRNRGLPKPHESGSLQTTTFPSDSFIAPQERPQARTSQSRCSQ